MKMDNFMEEGIIARSFFVGCAFFAECPTSQVSSRRHFERPSMLHQGHALKCDAQASINSQRLNPSNPTKDRISRSQGMRFFFNCGGIEWMETKHKI